MSRFECCCCFEPDVSFNRMIACPAGHVACDSCMERALQSAVGERRILTCLLCGALAHTNDTCALPYDELAIARSTNDAKLKTAYHTIVARKMLDLSGIENSYECPFCDNVVILEASADQFRYFRCDGCEKTSCRLCRQGYHGGSCNPQRREEEVETDRFIIVCYCGAKFYRGDGCNKVQCNNCRRMWCWQCKANLGIHAYQHFRHDSDANDTRCKLYGERPNDQQFAQPPSQVPVVRRRMDTERMDPEEARLIQFPCVESVDPVPDAIRIRKCRALLKRSGTPCPYKARVAGYCGKHVPNVAFPPAIVAEAQATP